MKAKALALIFSSALALGMYAGKNIMDRRNAIHEIQTKLPAVEKRITVYERNESDRMLDEIKKAADQSKKIQLRLKKGKIPKCHTNGNKNSRCV